MRSSVRAAVFLALGVAWPARLPAVVLYDQGQLTIDGVTLLRDKDDPRSYYYIPPHPRVSVDRATGIPEMLLALYVGDKEDTSGGLFHFLFTLELPEERVRALGRKLAEAAPGAVLRGPVPLLIDQGEEHEATPSFRLISSVVATGGDVDSKVVTSGRAPITPGSKAAVAARLDARSATLLHKSLTAATSDVSVSITAYYEAAVQGYEGRVTADLETAYRHFLSLSNRQSAYTKRELRSQTDELVRNGVVDVEVSNRGGLPLETTQASGLLDMVTSKLIDMLFDTTTGLSQLPEREPVPRDIVRERQKQGYFFDVFGGHDNPRYVTDNQFTLRRREDVRRGTFAMRFAHDTTIKVPFNSAGNIRGFFEEWSKDSRVFKIVTPQDSVFERREVVFQVDPDFYDAFKSVINSASITVRKRYPPEVAQAYVKEVRFSQEDVRNGTFSKPLAYPLLGLDGDEGNRYEYRVVWGFRGGKVVAVPEGADKYEASARGVVDLTPPKDKVSVYLEIDEAALVDAKVRRASLTVEYRLLGRRHLLSQSVRPDESKENFVQTSFLADPGTAYRYRLNWLLDGNRTVEGEWQAGGGQELAVVLTPPPAPAAAGR
jgi:hypothetical protein